MTTRRLFLVCVVGLVALNGSSQLGAQDVESESDLEEQLTFSVLGYGNGFFDGIFFEKEGDEGMEKVELVFFPDRRSPRYTVPADLASLRFFSETTDAKGRTVRVDRGQLRPPTGSERLLLLFREGPAFADKGVFDIQAIDESDDEWGAGCFRFLNLTGGSLQGALGEYAGEIEPGLSAIIRFPLDERRPLRLQFSLEQGGKKRVIYATETLPDANYGKLLVIKPPLEPDSLRIRVVMIW